MSPIYLHDDKIIKIASVCTSETHKKFFLSDMELKESKILLSVNFVAKRIAAKQALFNCLLKLGLEFHDYTAVSVLHDIWGKPYFSFSRHMKQRLCEHNVKSILLSIADEKCTAYAYVMIILDQA